MTEDRLERYREQLLDLGRRLRDHLTSLSQQALRPAGGEASGNQSNTPFHLADLAGDQFEHEMALGMLENKAESLEEIGAAVRRIDEGTYGLCEECGQPIASKRLDVLPYTRYCISCAEEVQVKKPIV